MSLSIHRNPMLGFVTVGIFTVLINLITFQVLIWLGASVYIATFFGNLVSIIVNYSGLSGVFQSKKRIQSILKYLTTWIAYYFLTIFLVVFLIGISLTPLEARVTTLLVVTPLNYLAQKLIVFRN